MKNLSTTYRNVTEDELNLPQSKKFHFGVFFITFQIDPSVYLQYLCDKFVSLGGKIEKVKIHSFDAIDTDLIINCTGIGARFLTGDKELLPLRGQVLRVEAPWIKTALYADDIYIIPGLNYVTIGGVRQHNNWTDEIEPYDEKKLWSKAKELFPVISKAKKKGSFVGLRPHRSFPRIEIETVGRKTIVHNYGHGGYGIMASPFTANKAVDLMKMILEPHSSKL